jgi:putative acetyltransferase
MQIRRFSVGDEASLLRVYLSSIRLVAARDYTVQQIQAWAPADLDADVWAEKMREIRPFVVEIDGEVVGYADVQPDGYIDHFFVSGMHGRQGIGSKLMQRIHEQAMSLDLTELTSHVSRTAEPFFVLHGFELVERRFPVLRGVTLHNALLRKVLA